MHFPSEKEGGRNTWRKCNTFASQTLKRFNTNLCLGENISDEFKETEQLLGDQLKNLSG